ncbi:MAG: porphobilinogen synthase [Candidatus Omnitrophica bacterium]|nr:porphobilinogen synthase [Candidatus Omnitrophota bacterium]
MNNGFKLSSLIYPVFVTPGKGRREAVSSMPGIYKTSPDVLVKEAGRLRKLGIEKVLLFGSSDDKDECGSSAYKYGNIVAQSVRSLKKRFPKLTVMTDVCLCAYTSHSHCGIIKPGFPVSISKEPTLSALAKMAVSHAEAGADYVAPSAMADKQVRVIRRILDKEGYRDTKIMGYSAKFASQFYGPFRNIADSAPKSGDRRQYQLDFTDKKRALLEVKKDIDEGADIVMVKPALSYLDIIRDVKNKFDCKLAAYNVSGEYSMVKAGSRAGYWDERKMVFEIITAIRRAGADIIITYHAPDIAKWVRGKMWGL